MTNPLLQNLPSDNLDELLDAVARLQQAIYRQTLDTVDISINVTGPGMPRFVTWFKHNVTREYQHFVDWHSGRIDAGGNLEWDSARIMGTTLKWKQ